MGNIFEIRDYSDWEKTNKKMLRPDGRWRHDEEIKKLIEIYPYAIVPPVTSSMRKWLDERNIRYVYAYKYIIFEKNEDTTAFALKYGSKIRLLHTTN